MVDVIGYLSPVPKVGNALPQPSQWFHDRVVAAGHPAPIWVDASAASTNNTAPVEILHNGNATLLVASTTRTLDAAIAWNQAHPNNKKKIVAVGMADVERFSVQEKITGVLSLTKQENQTLPAIIKDPQVGAKKVVNIFEQGNDSKQKQSDRIRGKWKTITEMPVGSPVNWGNVFSSLVPDRDGAIILSSPLTANPAQAPLVVAAANQHIRKNLFAGDGFPGGLMSYGPSRQAVYQAAADMAVSISNNGVVPPPVSVPPQLDVSQARWALACPGTPFPATLGGVPVHPVP